MDNSLTRTGSTAAWRRLRQAVLTRDLHSCAICGADANEVDHIKRRADGGTDDLDNLQALCSMHHKAKTQAENTRNANTAPTAVFRNQRTPSDAPCVFLSPTTRTAPSRAVFELGDSE